MIKVKTFVLSRTWGRGYVTETGANQRGTSYPAVYFCLYIFKSSSTCTVKQWHTWEFKGRWTSNSSPSQCAKLAVMWFSQWGKCEIKKKTGFSGRSFRPADYSLSVNFGFEFSEGLWDDWVTFVFTDVVLSWLLMVNIYDQGAHPLFVLPLCFSIILNLKLLTKQKVKSTAHEGAASLKVLKVFVFCNMEELLF